jgi:hypothetical protein
VHNLEEKNIFCLLKVTIDRVEEIFREKPDKESGEELSLCECK